MVSVIVCCYNGEQFIESCLDCLMAQTYKDIEIVLVDDGSTDASYSKAKQLESKVLLCGLKIKVLTQHNQGAGYAAMNGLRHAQGEYIMCFDVDDYLYPESIQKMALFLDSHPNHTVVRTNGYRVKKLHDIAFASLFVTNEQEKKNEKIFDDLMLGKTNNWAGSYMVRGVKLLNTYPDMDVLASRYGQNLQILAIAAYHGKAGFIDEPLMEYLQNPESFTQKNQTFEYQLNMLTQFEVIRLNIIHFLRINNPTLVNGIECAHARIKLSHAYNHKKKEVFMENFMVLKKHHQLSEDDNLYYHLINKNILRSYWTRIMIRIRKNFK